MYDFNIKKLMGYLLLGILFAGLSVGVFCIFYFIGSLSPQTSILLVLGIYAATALLLGICWLITYLICD
jgi:hypothetical protein